MAIQIVTGRTTLDCELTAGICSTYLFHVVAAQDISGRLLAFTGRSRRGVLILRKSCTLALAGSERQLLLDAVWDVSQEMWWAGKGGEFRTAARGEMSIRAIIIVIIIISVVVGVLCMLSLVYNISINIIIIV